MARGAARRRAAARPGPAYKQTKILDVLHNTSGSYHIGEMPLSKSCALADVRQPSTIPQFSPLAMKMCSASPLANRRMLAVCSASFFWGKRLLLCQTAQRQRATKQCPEYLGTH
jgi:hypothetical protein